MIGCLYELSGEIKAYPNKDRLQKKFPNAKIIKEVPVDSLNTELLQYKGVTVKEKQPIPEKRPYPYTYRVTCNTVLCAYSEEALLKLKEAWKINLNL